VKKPQRKPRSLAIEFRLPEDGERVTARILRDGKLVFVDSGGNEVVPIDMKRTLQYERSKGPKIQTRTTTERALVSVGGLEELCKLDAIFVLDTNSRAINGTKISAAAFVCCSIQHVSEGHKLKLEDQLNVYEFHGAPGNPELLAALKVANDVVRSKDYSEERSYGIVTDSELGAHDEINSRRMPLYGTHLLPAGFTLVYASDTGSEVLNKLIRFCDREASNYLRFFEKGSFPPIQLRALLEEPSVQYTYRVKGGLEVSNASLTGVRMRPGSRVDLYGIRKDTQASNATP
jgi:hypothetical protein